MEVSGILLMKSLCFFERGNNSLYFLGVAWYQGCLFGLFFIIVFGLFLFPLVCL